MSEQQQGATPANGVAGAGKELHPLDLLIIVARSKGLVIATPVVTGVLALLASLAMTPVFTSTARIMPPQQQQSSGVAAMLGQLGGLAGATGGIAGLKSPNDLYIGMLESRSVADKLIARFKLQQRYAAKTMDETRTALAGASDMAIGKKDGMLLVTVEDKDPQFAADLANAFVDELARLTQTIAVTEAAQRRLFFEQQLKDAKEQLALAETQLQDTQEKTGLIQPDGQVKAIIASVAQLKGAIAAKEVQLSAMRTFAAGQNPELLRAQEELRGMQGQLAKLEQKQPGTGDFMVATGKIPQAATEYVRGLRNVKYYETIFELLAKQFELAKIDEAKEGTVIQLLDKAIPAERKTKPRRAAIVLAGVFGGLALGVALAFLRFGLGRARSNPANRERWRQLGAAWGRAPRP